MVDGARKGERALTGLSGKAATTGSTFNKLNDRTMLLKRAFQGLIVVAVAAFFLKATTAASTFETKMAEVSTLVDTTTFSMGNLEDAIKKQSLQFGALPAQQAAAAYQIISAGAGTAKDAILLLDASNRLAIGGVTDVATAADGLTTVLNAYGKKASEAGNVSDAMFVAMRAGKTTIGELSASIGKVAPLAVQAGVSFEELVGSIAALTKGGISTRESVTGVRAILAAVIKPTSEASEMAKKLGLNFSVAGLQSKGFIGFMKDLKEKTGGSTDIIAKLFGGVEALIPVLALAGQAGIDFTQIMVDMENKGGATAAAFEKMSNTFSFQSARLRAGLTIAMIELGSVITSVLTPAIRFLADNFEAISRFVKLLAAGLAIALLPAIVGLVPVVASLTAGLIGMAAAFLLTPFGMIAGAITVAAAALAYFGDVSIKVAGINTTVWNSFVAGLSVAWDLLGEGAGIIFDTFDSGLKSAGTFFSTAIGWLGGFVEEWGFSFDSIGDFFKKAINLYIGIYVGLFRSLGTIIGALPRIWKSALAAAANAVTSGVENIVNTFVEGLALIGDAADAIDPFSDLDRGGAIRKLKIDLSDAHVEAESFAEVFKDIGRKIKTQFSDALDTDFVGAISTAIGELAGPIMERFRAKLMEIEGQSSLTEEASAALATTLTEIVAPAFDDMGDSASDAKDKLEELNRKREEFIEGLQADFDQIREQNGGAVDLVREWYAEQIILIDSLGFKYEDYADKLEVVFNERLAIAYQTNLENATDWRSGIERAVNGMGSTITSEADVAESALTTMFTGAGDAMNQFLETGKLEFKAFAQSIMADIAKMIIKMLIMKALQMALGMATGGAGASPLIGAFANLLPGGSGRVGGGRATGGMVHGPGSGTSDSISAMLSNGEFVVNAKATDAFRPLLEAINSGNAGDLLMKAEGGMSNEPMNLHVPRNFNNDAEGSSDDASGERSGDVSIVNLFDTDTFNSWAQSTTGKRVILNIVSEAG